MISSRAPTPGTKAPKGSTIDVKVSNGPPTSAVPDVSGEPGPGAASTLEATGFKVTRSRRTDVADPNQDEIVQPQDPVGSRRSRGERR